eukprot:g880.t1
MRTIESNRKTWRNRKRCILIGVVVLLICISFLLVRNVWRPNYQLSKVKFISVLPEEQVKPLKQVAGVNYLNPVCRDFHSQHGEDVKLFLKYWAFPKVKRDGVFLEIGALDGKSLSNSYWYEMCLGWTGVLIEGHPTAAHWLRIHRPHAINIEAAACDKDNGTVKFVGSANGVSGEISKMPKQFAQTYHGNYIKGKKEETHEVKCRLISSMLREAGVDHIDFWTLDVEGAEFIVLNTFDWEHVAVHVLVIENDKDEAVEYPRRHEFLTSKGMQFVSQFYINELWFNPSYPNITFPTPNKT